MYGYVVEHGFNQNPSNKRINIIFICFPSKSFTVSEKKIYNPITKKYSLSVINFQIDGFALFSENKKLVGSFNNIWQYPIFFNLLVFKSASLV